jgi:hypothetical protein
LGLSFKRDLRGTIHPPTLHFGVLCLKELHAKVAQVPKLKNIAWLFSLFFLAFFKIEGIKDNFSSKRHQDNVKLGFILFSFAQKALGQSYEAGHS